ncbi:hypothetical protein [Actinophytocola sp. NPDC049390]|uniref:hypothetical protein n=1 Tax=Actinophytocola sp. NPDC049390 TaxID=3363894 RepID=UPI00378EC1A4
MSDVQKSPRARLRGALAAAALPPALRQTWATPPPDPTSGQLWRARWGAVTQLLLVLESAAQSVRAAPVTSDPDMADDSAGILAEGASDLSIPLVVWLDDAASVPLRVLDRFVGALAEQHRRVQDVPRGRPIVSDVDERAVQRARGQDAMDVFVSARWAPEGTGTLKEILGKADRSRLSAVLALPDRQVIALLRGRKGVTPDQAERLAPVVGESAEVLLASNPPLPEDLVADLDLPVYRAMVNALAKRRGLEEIEAWRFAGYAVAGVANRQTEGPALSWREQLDRYFEAVLDDS